MSTREERDAQKLVRRRERMGEMVEYAKEKLVGKSIVSVRFMTDKEAEEMDWFHLPIVIGLDDGSFLFASQDSEGNDAGSLFGGNPDEEWTFWAMRREGSQYGGLESKPKWEWTES